MSLDKTIKYGKEHRKPYRGSKAIDRTCRNHGSCPWCRENRLHKFRDKHSDSKEDMMKDEIVVSFMNSETRKQVPDIPDEAVVITELLQDDMIVTVPRDEFLEWLLNG